MIFVFVTFIIILWMFMMSGKRRLDMMIWIIIIAAVLIWILMTA